MKRQYFIILAAIVPGAFGLVMMLAPQAMLSNSLVAQADETIRVATVYGSCWLPCVWFGIEFLGSLSP